MSERIRILCTGSDRRQVYAAARLSGNAQVYTYLTDGEAEGAVKLESLDELKSNVDILLLPMCQSGLTIPAAERLNCTELVPVLKKAALVTGGMMPTVMIEFFHSRGYDTADYIRRDELAVKNAVPTAEGALQIVLNECNETAAGMNVLIVGWGRVAKACARLFKAVGSYVTVAARRADALAEAETNGFRAIHTDSLVKYAQEFRVLINTVPALMFSEQIVGTTSTDCLIIDLASQPGGTDFAACVKHERKAIHALSLPGKCAPKTAGEIIADTVMNIYHERSGRNVT